MKYLTANDLKAHETISGGSVNIIVKDPEQQVVGKFYSAIIPTILNCKGL